MLSLCYKNLSLSICPAAQKEKNVPFMSIVWDSRLF